MSPIQIVLLVSVILGICLIIYSLIMFKREQSGASIAAPENTARAIDISIEEMERTMEEFSSMASDAFIQMEQKYQELLFLYSLIDEKKKEVAALYSEAPLESYTKGSLKNSQSNNKSQPEERVIVNPKLEEITRLMSSGQSVAEVAKSLNMGQGEVKLILELGKVR